MIRYNPFVPNNTVCPGMFTGRSDELRMMSQCLLQAKYSNPHYFLIEGERGIGKSSLLLYIDHLARGNLQGLSSEKFQFIVISVDTAGVDSQADLIRLQAEA